ncbi:MAG: DUF938 domain-containing protein [bacterium]
MEKQFLHHSTAADNNKEHILSHLRELLTEPATLLEIGSGSGQHAVHFASALRHITWQPSDQGEYFEPLKTNIQSLAPDNVKPPVYLDLNNPDWSITTTNHIYTANVLHIVPESLLSPLFIGASKVMTHNGLLCIYGPFKYNGKFTTDSNERFDGWLTDRNPLSGVRDIGRLQELAEETGFVLRRDFDMPANNQFLIFEKAF